MCSKQLLLLQYYKVCHVVDGLEQDKWLLYFTQSHHRRMGFEAEIGHDLKIIIHDQRCRAGMRSYA